MRVKCIHMGFGKEEWAYSLQETTQQLRILYSLASHFNKKVVKGVSEVSNPDNEVRTASNKASKYTIQFVYKEETGEP